MKKINNFILDVDGVMTDGCFYYTVDGKVMKVFGPDDHDALLGVNPYLNIQFVTGDRKGFDISKKRISDDMKFPLELVSTFERVKWMKENDFNLDETIYMGDGIFDAAVFEYVAYGIAPANAFYSTLEKADFNVITANSGQEALKLFNQNIEPDIIITDLNMPNMDGFELIQNIKNIKNVDNIPIFLLTTEFNFKKKLKAKELNVTGWIQKPYNSKDFIRIITGALK